MRDNLYYQYWGKADGEKNVEIPCLNHRLNGLNDDIPYQNHRFNGLRDDTDFKIFGEIALSEKSEEVASAGKMPDNCARGSCTNSMADV